MLPYWLAAVALVLVTCPVTLADPIPGARRPTTTEVQRPVDAKAILAMRLHEVKLDGASLEDVLGFFRDVAAANIHTNWPAIEAAGVKQSTPVYLSEKDTSLGEALAKALAQLPRAAGAVAYDSDDEVIYVSTEQDLADQRPFRDRQHAKRVPAAAIELLSRRIHAVDEGHCGGIRPVALPERATIRQALGELSNRTGVVIRADDGFAHAGIDNDLRVTARFRNVTLQTALGVVLSQTLKLPSLNYNVVNDEVVISALPKPATD